MLIILIVLSSLSVCLNGFLLWKRSSLNPGAKQTSYDAKQLLHDLTDGDALVRVSRVDPSDVFLRSPRDL